MTVTRHVLPDGHGAARAARGLVSEALAGRPDLDDLLLVTSELVTNAVEHGAPPLELEVASGPSAVQVTVSCEHLGGRPEPRRAEDHDDHGRGLALVSRLSRDWGWAVQAGRMRVWASFDPTGE